MPRTSAQRKGETGGEFFETDTHLVFGAYFCKEEDGSYRAKMYGCDAILDHQSNVPAQQYASRHEIRKALAEVLTNVTDWNIPEDQRGKSFIVETRRQLQELLRLLNDDDAELPALLPDDDVQAKLDAALSTAITLVQDLECDGIRNALRKPHDPSLELDQSAIQQLRVDTQNTLEDFNAMLARLEDGSAEMESIFPQLSRTYNTLILYASILDENGYKLSRSAQEYLTAFTGNMCTLFEQMGGNMFSVRTFRGTPRPFPPNQSSLDDTRWNELMQQYDEAVHHMATAEHMAERLTPRIGAERAYRMLIDAYNAFIRSAKEIQVSTGPLKHYQLVQRALAPQLQRLAEAIDFPTDELEAME
ncbi:TPA: hypothetical protein DCL30_01985 [Candidatus Peribacteria bacterium]|nr:MAG: hypothetical protein A3J91_03690 [Candidatus Peribacteria bacterium RIFOXYC2_FULL_58_10]OGJ85258.1 MAG: hypothetical protein A2529_02230 [Candidatus Peribacteria bacterium RIFOXYD2_FULL_58_15]HAI98296.1 hypothetical protein [Candidatus Peribacteria bacterium]HAS33954.1 hypothetical protein [Candidatus Peribacteria bacterium]